MNGMSIFCKKKKKNANVEIIFYILRLLISKFLPKQEHTVHQRKVLDKKGKRRTDKITTRRNIYCHLDNIYVDRKTGSQEMKKIKSAICQQKN